MIKAQRRGGAPYFVGKYRCHSRHHVDVLAIVGRGSFGIQGNIIAVLLEIIPSPQSLSLIAIVSKPMKR